MTEEYIKKLEEQNKLLEETLSKYKEKFGELVPEKYSEHFIIENLVKTNIPAITSINSSNVFTAQSNNGNVLSINDSGIGFKANNITIDAQSIVSTVETIDAQSIVSTVESEALKQINEVKTLLKTHFRKSKPRFKRYCKFLIRKIKRKFK